MKISSAGPWRTALQPKSEDFLNLTEDIVEPVLAELAAEIRDHQITLVNRLHNQRKGKVPVKGSKLWLKSAFRNLINNGIKYGGRGCTIVVDCETKGSTSRLTVYNTGQTVPEASRSMLFSPMAGVCGRPRNRRGLGLGLSLSRDIIQNYGGDIWYEARTRRFQLCDFVTAGLSPAVGCGYRRKGFSGRGRQGTRRSPQQGQEANYRLLPPFFGGVSARRQGPWPGRFAEMMPGP